MAVIASVSIRFKFVENGVAVVKATPCNACCIHFVCKLFSLLDCLPMYSKQHVLHIFPATGTVVKVDSNNIIWGIFGLVSSSLLQSC